MLPKCPWIILNSFPPAGDVSPPPCSGVRPPRRHTDLSPGTVTVAAASNLANMPGWPPHSSPQQMPARPRPVSRRPLSTINFLVCGRGCPEGRPRPEPELEPGTRGKADRGNTALPGRRRMKLVVDGEYPSNQHYSLIFIHSLCPRRSKTNEVILI